MGTKKYNSVLLNNYYGNIEEALSNPSNMRILLKYISGYIDKNSEALNYSAPTKRINFATTGEDAEIFYRTLNIDPKEMLRDLNNIESIRKISPVIKNPIFITIALCVRYCNDNKKTKELNLFLIYLSFSMYWSIQWRSFKFEPNENSVRYTMNRINNKFYFKRYGTVFKSLYVATESLNNNNAKTLSRDSDLDIVEYVMFLRSRISNLVVKMAKEIYKDLDAKNYMNMDGDSYDEEKFNLTTNVSGYISNLSSKTMISFLQSRLDNKIINMASRLSSCSSEVTRNTLLAVKDNEQEKVEAIIRNIIIIYLEDEKNEMDSVGSQKFINQSISIYNRSNTNNKLIIEIKDNLNYFLTKYSDKYSQTDREATKNNYRKSILIYFIFLISRAA